jgi:hypothetical protein
MGATRQLRPCAGLRGIVSRADLRVAENLKATAVRTLTAQRAPSPIIMIGTVTAAAGARTLGPS